MKLASSKPVRCAIYTRVSTEHGLDQEFNSLDAQYDAASAYIKSQAHAGWTLIRVNMTISLAFLAPNLVKAAVEGRLPVVSASNGSAIRRLNGADSLRRSDSIRNSCSAGPRSRSTVAQKSEFRV